MQRRITYLFTLLLAFSLAASVAAQSFYDGETVEIVVPYSSGGGTDGWARAIAPFLQQYLGDNTTVQVINEPGSSGIAGANSFAVRRDPDGLSLLVSSGSNALPYVLGVDAVEYDFNNFAAITGSPVGGVVYVSPDTGVSSPAELCTTDELLIYGGISATGLDLVPLVAFNLLGLEVFEILGYDGNGPTRVAFEQGETNLDYETSPSFLSNVEPLVDEGKAVPLFSFGIIDAEGNLVRDPAFPDLPSFKEVYVECNGMEPSGVEWDAYKAVVAAGFAIQKILWTHGGAPAEAVAALKDAATQMIADPEFQAVKADLIGDYEFSVGDVTTAQFAAASSLSDEAIGWLNDFIASKE